ncbi:MAG TPA: DUF916 domain-containing protein [Acidimicrobiales bacterium]|nr:DUF916 domain-containing protein [Acidimicrobiales bacterium]
MAAIGLALAAVVILSGPVPARAGSIGPWGVAPATTATNQKSRPFFDYRQPAGGTIHDAISIANLGDFPLTFDLYTADGFNLSNGAFALRGKADPRRDVGMWTSLSVPAVTVPPHDQAIVPFTISVPLDVTPGDHAGGIVALARPVAAPAPGSQVVTRQGVGARIYLRVPGPLHPSLAITSLDLQARTGAFGGGKADVQAVLVNTGNTRVDAIVRFRGAGPFGLGAKTLPAIHLDSLLPGSRIHLQEKWSGLPVAGPYRVTLSVTSAEATARGSATAWIIPWAILVAIALLAAGAWYAWRRGRRNRRKPSPSSSPRLPTPVKTSP